MGVPTIKTGPMTVEEYFAFTDTRPDNEKWELIDGEPVLNASPSRLHQIILDNLVFLLGTIRAPATAILGIRRRVSASECPTPVCQSRIFSSFRPELLDAILMAERPATSLPTFEILSPSTAERDLRWKRVAYTSLSSLTHYIVIAQDAVDVVVFARDSGFAERRYTSLGDLLELPALGISLPLSEIYRDTGLE